MERNLENGRLIREELERVRLTRLELMKRGGLTALMLSGMPVLLAACGGGDEPAATEPAATGAATETTQATTAAAPQASGVIDFLSWEGYDLPIPTMDAWREANGIEVRSSYIATNDDVPAKLKAGGGEGIDLIVYTHGFKDSWQSLGLFTPLDEAKLPNLANLLPYFASDTNNYWVDPDGTRLGVPWSWGGVGLTYDTNVLTSPPTSYDVLFEPAYKDKIVVVDDPIGTYNHAAQIVGVDVWQLSEADLAKINDWLKLLLAQAKTIAASYGDAAGMLASGEAVFAWSGWAAMDSFAKDAGSDTIRTVLPKEGGYSFADAWALPPGADNPDAAYAWMNQTLIPEVNAEAANYLIGGVTVEGAADLLTPELRALYDYDNLEAFFELAPLTKWPPAESDEYVTYDQILAAWQEVKVTA